MAGGGGWMKLETASSRAWEVSLVWIFLLPARVSLYGMMGWAARLARTMSDVSWRLGGRGEEMDASRCGATGALVEEGLPGDGVRLGELGLG